jgi:hypothetical protein
VGGTGGSPGEWLPVMQAASGPGRRRGSRRSRGEHAPCHGPDPAGACSALLLLTLRICYWPAEEADLSVAPVSAVPPRPA